MRRSFALFAGAALLAGYAVFVHRSPAGVSTRLGEGGVVEVKQECPEGGSAAARAREADVAPNPRERELGMLLESDPGQRRRRFVFNPVLARVARQRARDMASRNYLEHTDPDGFGANYHVLRAGYRLPGFYDRSPAGNNIESIGGGYESAADAWNGWMGSTGHRTHLLGLESFYREQSEYGVGYAYSPGTGYGHYWAVLIAKPGCRSRS